MLFREFFRDDNEILSSWFEEKDVRDWLESPWSDTELDEVLQEKEGALFVIEEEGELIAMIGCYSPNSEIRHYVISEMVVNPEKRRLGYGKLAIAELLKKYGPDKEWWAYIEPENVKSRRLFETCGWMLQSEKPDETHLLTYTFCT